MDKWDELNQKERAMEEQEDTLIREMNQLYRINDGYEEHLHKGRLFMSELQDTFHETDSHLSFDSIREAVTHESKQILVDVEEAVDEVSVQVRTLELDLEDIRYEKRAVFLAENEGNK